MASDLTDVTWRKSSRSDQNGGMCVEVADLRDGVAVRDSKDPFGPVLAFTPTGWHAFLTSTKTGHFDPA